MTSNELFDYFCKNARYYGVIRGKPSYAVEVPGQHRVLHASDTEELMKALAIAVIPATAVQVYSKERDA